MCRVSLQLLGCAAALLIAACQKPAPPEPAPPSASTPTSAEAPNPADEGVTMRYRCESGLKVTIMRGETARISLADGRVVEIERTAESSPPSYRGEAVAFEVGGDGATLAQDDVGAFDCTAED